MLIALSIIVVCIKYRKKENSLFYVLIVYLSLIILINIGFILFTQEIRILLKKTADATLMIDYGNGGCRDFWIS